MLAQVNATPVTGVNIQSIRMQNKRIRAANRYRSRYDRSLRFDEALELVEKWSTFTLNEFLELENLL